MSGAIIGKGTALVARGTAAAAGAVAGNWLPWALGAALVASLVAGFFTVRAAWRAEGAARIVAEDARAVADQKAKDAETSRRLLNDQVAAFRKLEASAAEAMKGIQDAPVTDGCGPATDRAVDWLRNNAPGSR